MSLLYTEQKPNVKRLSVDNSKVYIKPPRMRRFLTRVDNYYIIDLLIINFLV